MPAHSNTSRNPSGKSKGCGVHRVVTDAKHCAGGSFFWTEVAFRSTAEIDALMDALRNLKKSRSVGFHVHIADLRLAKNGPPSSAEIVFYGPARRRSKERAKAVRAAEHLLTTAKSENH